MNTPQHSHKNCLGIFFSGKSNKAIVHMHMHIEERTNDRSVYEHRQKNCTNTDYKANEYNSDAYADL